MTWAIPLLRGHLRRRHSELGSKGRCSLWHRPISVVVAAALLVLMSNKRMAQRLILAALTLVVHRQWHRRDCQRAQNQEHLSHDDRPDRHLVRVYGKRQRNPTDTAKS